MLTSSILPLNRGGFAISTLAPPLYCNRVVTYCCRPAIKVKSYSFWVKGGGLGAAGCSTGCCYWDMYGGGGNSSSNSDDDVSSYKNKQSSLSKLMTSYWLEE